jgi:hypothetical protein
MNQNEARSLVAKLNAGLLQSGLAVDTNPVVPFKVADRVRFSWPEARVSQGLFADQHFASLSEYRTFVEGRHYTCLLNEGSLIQISFDFRRNEMVAHRFCFYPCPLEFPEDGYPQDLDAWNDLLEAELSSQIEALAGPLDAADERESTGTSGLLRLRSPLRFDFEPENRAATEPSSHVHINGAGARIPVHAGLSLAQFMTFVISHYYPSHSHVLDEFAPEFCDRSISPEDEVRLHFDCRQDL